MARQQGSYRQWDGSQWASRATAGVPSPQEAEPRWNKFEWVGDRGAGIAVGRRQPQDMPEGESRLSGYRHNPGVQHWVGHGNA